MTQSRWPKQQSFILSQVQRLQVSDKVAAGLVSGKDSLSGLQMALSPSVLTWPLLCACGERDISDVSSSSSKDTYPKGLEFHSNFTSLKFLSPNTIPLVGKASTCEICGDIIQSITSL